MIRRRRPRGTLSTTLLIFILVVGVMVVSIACTMFQLNQRRDSDARDAARRLAESAARMMMARLLADPTINGGTCPLVEVTLPSYSDAVGVAALEPAEAARLEIPLSVNNLAGTGSQPGWGDTVVAPESANIVGVGRYRGYEQRVEVVLHRPKFPYVVSSSVPIKATGLHVFGVSDPSALARGFGSVPQEMKVPGHIVTNASDGSGPAMQLSGSSTLIEGDAQSRGTLEVLSGAVVTGALRPLADIAPLPSINVASFDTQNKPGVSEIDVDRLGATTLSGFNHKVGGLTFTDGLALDGGVLYVDGGVTIKGGLSGTGAVIANGPVYIEGGGALSGLTGTAVVASGDIRLEGTEAQRAEYRGLLYTEGSLTCKHVNVAGSVVVNSGRGDAKVTLESADFAEHRDLGAVSVPVVTQTGGGAGGGGGDAAGFPATLHANLISSGDPFGYGVAPRTQTVRGTSNSAPTLFTANMNGPAPNYSSPPAGYPVTHAPTQAEPWYQIGVPDPMPADPITLGSIRINNPDPDGELDEIGPNGDGWQGRHLGDFTDRDSARGPLVDVARAWGSTNAEGATDRFLDAAQQYMINTVPEIVRVWNINAKAAAQSGGSGSGGSGGGGGGTRTVTPWKLDLNEFFNLADRIRVLSWRPL